MRLNLLLVMAVSMSMSSQSVFAEEPSPASQRSTESPIQANPIPRPSPLPLRTPLSPLPKAEQPPRSRNQRPSIRSAPLPKRSERSSSHIKVGGLIFVTADYRDDVAQPTTFDVALKGARASLNYKKHWLEAKLGVEFAKNAKVRDAALRITKRGLALRVGRFKQPASVLLEESRWRLPVADRGGMAKLLGDAYALGGRRVGAQLEWKHNGELTARAKVGVFQGTDSDGDPIETEGLTSQTLSARIELAVDDVELGGFATRRAVQTNEFIDHPLAAGVDLRFEHVIGQTVVTLWAEYVAGQAPELAPALETMGRMATFAEARALLSLRIDVGPPPFHLDPFIRVGILNPDIIEDSDSIRDLAAGLNIGVRDKLRFAIEVGWQRSSPKTPAELAIDARRNLMVLAGSAF